MWWSTLWGGIFGEDGRYDAFATVMEILRVRSSLGAYLFLSLFKVKAIRPDSWIKEPSQCLSLIFSGRREWSGWTALLEGRGGGSGKGRASICSCMEQGEGGSSLSGGCCNVLATVIEVLRVGWSRLGLGLGGAGEVSEQERGRGRSLECPCHDDGHSWVRREHLDEPHSYDAWPCDHWGIPARNDTFHHSFPLSFSLLPHSGLHPCCRCGFCTPTQHRRTCSAWMSASGASPTAS